MDVVILLVLFMRVCGRRAGVLVLFLCALLPCHASDSSAAALIKQGHYKQARAILENRLQSNPNDARAYEEMSKVSEAFARWDEAIQQAEKAVSLDRKDPECQAALADAIGSKLAGAQLGWFQKLSLARRFKREAEQALQLDPNNVDANQDLMEFHLDAPGIVGGDKKKAVELAERMIHNNPVRGFLMKFEIAQHEKKNGELDSLLRQAIEADPKSYEARMQAANFHLGQGSSGFGQAEQQARAAIHIAPGVARAYVVLANIYAQQGRWQELDSMLDSAQREAPDDLAPSYYAAVSIFNSGEPQQLPRAEKYMRTYLSQPPEGAEPTLATAHWRLGLILEREGHRDKAKEEMKQALSLDPSLQTAKRDLKRLQ